jgi:phospholipase C
MPDPIEHVVVLMMENHSFDQMLGSLSGELGLDGIDAANPKTNPDYPDTGQSIAQTPTTMTSIDLDPAHEFDDVQRQLAANNSGFIKDFVMAHPTCGMTEKQQIMAYYPPGKLTVLHKLARNFAVCDKWFSSMPGPTWQNRFFVHSGTCKGHVKMPSGIFDPNFHLYDQDTIYDRLLEKNISWKIYHQGEAQTLVMVHQLKPTHLIHYHEMVEFFDDAHGNEADFPQYSFIEPCYSGSGQNDQHPPSDIMKGELLIAQVYNAIRLNPELWKKTLLVILYDEHGGFYDHVVPPTFDDNPIVVAPDNNTVEFNFQQLGLRVPAILVSPWIDKQVVHTVFDHTSLLKYLIDKWGLGPLGNRTAKANSFAPTLLARATARADADVPGEITDRLVSPVETQNKKVNENQKALISFSQKLETHLAQVDDMGAIGSRSLKMMEGSRAQFAVAKDRFERFIHETKLGNVTPKGPGIDTTTPGGGSTPSV